MTYSPQLGPARKLLNLVKLYQVGKLVELRGPDFAPIVNRLLVVSSSHSLLENSCDTIFRTTKFDDIYCNVSNIEQWGGFVEARYFYSINMFFNCSSRVSQTYFRMATVYNSRYYKSVWFERRTRKEGQGSTKFDDIWYIWAFTMDLINYINVQMQYSSATLRKSIRS